MKQSGRTDVKVIGLGLPNMYKPYIKAGITESIVLWNTMDLGALAVARAEALTTGSSRRVRRRSTPASSGKFEVVGDEVRLG